MSEVAGRLAVVEGAQHLSANECGCSVLISGVLRTDPIDGDIIGAGVFGANAAKLAVRMGACIMICYC